MIAVPHRPCKGGGDAPHYNAEVLASIAQVGPAGDQPTESLKPSPHLRSLRAKSRGLKGRRHDLKRSADDHDERKPGIGCQASCDGKIGAGGDDAPVISYDASETER